MSNLEGRKDKQIENNVEKKDGVIGRVKKATGALVLTIALGSNPTNAKIVNDLKSYEDACLNSVAGEKVTILVSEEFYRKHRKEILKTIPEEDTCEIKGYDKKDGTVNFPVIEKNGKKYFQISFKAGEWDTDASDVVAEKEKEAEQAQKEAEQAQKEAEKLEKLVKAEGYLGDLQDKTILIGQNIKNEKLVNNTLDEVLKDLKIGNLKGNKYGEGIKEVLGLVKFYYKGKNKQIVNKINTLLKRLNLE